MRADLTPGAQIAQAVHAAAGYAIEHPALAASTEIVVCLAVADQTQLLEHAGLVETREPARPFHLFHEPDLGAGELTALAIVDTGEQFSNLPLAGRETAMT